MTVIAFISTSLLMFVVGYFIGAWVGSKITSNEINKEK